MILCLTLQRTALYLNFSSIWRAVEAICYKDFIKRKTKTNLSSRVLEWLIKYHRAHIKVSKLQSTPLSREILFLLYSFHSLLFSVLHLFARKIMDKSVTSLTFEGGSMEAATLLKNT